MHPSPADLCFRRQESDTGCFLVWENERMRLGFSERGSKLSGLRALCSGTPLQLRQLHSAVIRPAEASRSGERGDGWIVRRRGLAVLIKTADCVPLFFWSDDGSLGGILHAGWRGLQKEIEKNLLLLLRREGLGPDRLRFLIGPAINKECYEVGEDVHRAFSHSPWRQQVFAETSPGRYLLDLKRGIRLSLQEEGVPAGSIADVGLCTCCLKERFPSYRRDGKTGNRIYSFFLLR